MESYIANGNSQQMSKSNPASVITITMLRTNFKEYKNLRGNTLDQEMENLKASIPISFILCTSSCKIYQFVLRTITLIYII